MKLYKCMENNANTAHKIQYYHTNMNGVVFHVDST